jgi:hypothetical protein
MTEESLANTQTSTRALDDGYKLVKAKLTVDAGPFDPWTGNGDRLDDASYVSKPGINFMRPWLAVRNGAAFQWPGGMEGFSLVIDPTLGIHKYIGDNDAVVEVIHAGEEHFTLSGNFVGDSAPDLIRALRAVVKADSKTEGKILWLPEVVQYAQRVQIVHAEFSRDQEARGRDSTYSIEFVRMGHIDLALDPTPVPVVPQPKQGKHKPARSVRVDAKHNTLRKIALWKLKSSAKWRVLYNANMQWFVRHSVPLHKAPDYRLPLGLKLNY